MNKIVMPKVKKQIIAYIYNNCFYGEENIFRIIKTKYNGDIVSIKKDNKTNCWKCKINTYDDDIFNYLNYKTMKITAQVGIIAIPYGRCDLKKITDNFMVDEIYDYKNKELRLRCFSDNFDEVEEGEMIPIYKIEYDPIQIKNKCYI